MSYCKLYIDSKFSMDEMDGVFDLGFKECIKIPEVEYSLFINDCHIEGAAVSSSTYPVDRSKYFVEIDSDPVIRIDENDFQRSLAELVHWLRLKCEFVVASCDFEDYIVETTGWNWTPESPLPPASPQHGGQI